MATIKQRIDIVTEDVMKGKQDIANAITEKGVQTTSSVTFSTMASNINSIKTIDPDLIPTDSLIPLINNGITVLFMNPSPTFIPKNVTITDGSNDDTFNFKEPNTSHILNIPNVYDFDEFDVHLETRSGINTIFYQVFAYDEGNDIAEYQSGAFTSLSLKITLNDFRSRVFAIVAIVG